MKRWSRKASYVEQLWKKEKKKKRREILRWESIDLCHCVKKSCRNFLRTWSELFFFFFFCSPSACNPMLLTWRIVEIGKVIGRSCAPVYRRIYRVLRAIFVSNRFSTILDVIRRRRLGRGVTVGSRINRKKKNNIRLVMFAIQYPFLHSFFILFFYLFIFFIFFFLFFFYASLYSFIIYFLRLHTRVSLLEIGDRRSRDWSFVARFSD